MKTLFRRYLFSAFIPIIVICFTILPSCDCGGDSDESDDDLASDDTESATDDSSDDTSAPDDTTDDDFEGQPDIVVIMADDLDCKTLQRLIDDGRMPNLENYIINAGTSFSESFVTNPLCCPSRATFMTGQYSHNNGVLNNDLPLGGASLLADASTLATWLDDAGYITGIVGKYLNGYGEDTAENYIPPGWDDWQVLVDPTTYMVYNYKLDDNGTIIEYGINAEDYQTDVLANRAAEFIRESSADEESSPFFLWVTPLAPHTEFPEEWYQEFHGFADWYALTIRPAPRHEGIYNVDLPDEPNFNEADVTDKPAWVQIRPLLNATDLANARAQYNSRLGAMLAVDDLIGTVAGALEETGRLSRTVLLFTSDNGFLLGKHRVPQKTADYEESIRVPLYVRVPWLGKQSTAGIVLNNDLAPTLAAFGGAVPGIDVDGRSFLPLLENPSAVESWGRKRFFIQHWAFTDLIVEVPTYNAIRTGPAALEAPEMLYVEYVKNDVVKSSEFYDMIGDPYQLDSLSADESATRVSQMETLSGEMAQFLDCAGSDCRSLEDADLDP